MAPRSLMRLFNCLRRKQNKTIDTEKDKHRVKEQMPREIKEKKNYYTYEPIQSPDHIRLLRLDPGHGDTPLNCSLTQVSLDDMRPYEAISYAWGDPNDCKSITCDGQTVDITSNLFDALQTFRLQHQPRYLWADALCINQQNLEERGYQVQHMSRIYRKATKVLLWLGKEDAKIVDAAFDWLRHSLLDADTPAQLDKTTRDALKLMLSCNVFQRGWVIQEFALAPSVDVCWGYDYIDARLFSLANTEELFDLAAELSGLGNCVALFQMCNIRNIQQAGKTYKPLELMHVTQDFYFTDDRDRVYGILALPLAFDRSIYGDTYIKPDYTKDKSYAFRNFAEACLVRDNNLNTLLFVNNVEIGLEDHPSWLPDWTKLERDWTALMNNGYECGQEHMAISKPTSNAIDHVSIKGIVVSHIDDILGGQTSADYDRRAQALLQSIWDQFDHSCVVHTALSLKSHTAALDVHAEPADTDYSEIRKTACREFLALHLEPDKDGLPTYTSGRMTRDEFAGQFGWMYRVSTMGHLFFRTKQGMLGLGPANIQKGDAVVVLFAGTGPNLSFVLRPVDGGFWKLLGPCYVHDIRDGSAVRRWKESGEEVRTFDIS